MLIGYIIDYVRNFFSCFFDTCKYDFYFFLNNEITGAQEPKALSGSSQAYMQLNREREQRIKTI
jgi:hypothetical protein